jgi:DNA polymerase I-like protein with 3'-5' exonuclease and polymerase domains
MEYVTIRLFRWIDANDLQDVVRPLLQVHDQVLFEVKKEYLEQHIPTIVNIMTDLPKYNENGEELPFRLPMTVDVSVGTSWGNAEQWG